MESDKIGVYVNGEFIAQSVPVIIEGEVGAMTFLFMEGDLAYFQMIDGKACFRIPSEHLSTFAKMKEGELIQYKKP